VATTFCTVATTFCTVATTVCTVAPKHLWVPRTELASRHRPGANDLEVAFWLLKNVCTLI